MENVKTFDFDVKLENDTLVVEQGAILGQTDPNKNPNAGNEVGFGAALSVYGTLQGAIVKDHGYIGVGVNGVANNVYVVANGAFEVWANAVANDAIVGRIDLGAGSMTVNAGAKAYNTTVNVGQLHINGIAHDTTVGFDGFAGVGNGAKAYDSIVRFGGDMKVFNGGFADDTRVWGGTVEVLAGGFADDTEVFGGEFIVQADAMAVSTEVTGGEMLIAGGALVEDIEVSNGGDVTFFASNTYVGFGDLEIGQDGAVNTWGAVGWAGSVSLEFDGASQLDKARIDNLNAFEGALFDVEVDSSLDAGRYLIAANANDIWLGQGINISDGDVDEFTIIVGGEGAYLNDKTYAFNIDANGNLYMDVMEGAVAYTDYTATNTVGAGNFGNGVGEELVWINAEKTAVAIAGIGAFATAGEFAGIGDFDGNGLDDILFADGNDLNAIYFFEGAVGTANYKDVLAGGTVADFQIAENTTADFNTYDSVYVKYADVYREAILFSLEANGEYKFIATGNYDTCVK